MKKILVFIVIGIAVLSCSKDSQKEEGTNFSCSSEVLIDAEQFDNAPNDELIINTLEISGNCLKINFSSNGCNGEEWELKLIDSDAIALSYPPQRHLRLSLKNNELCEAHVTKELFFDISDLQVSGDNVYLNFTNSDSGILYQY